MMISTKKELMQTKSLLTYGVFRFYVDSRQGRRGFKNVSVLLNRLQKIKHLQSFREGSKFSKISSTQNVNGPFAWLKFNGTHERSMILKVHT